MGLSFFDMSHEVKTSLDMGTLIPIYWRDVIPGDKIKLQSRFLIRTMPFIAPVMHKLDAYIRFYYVPYRLLAKDFVDIIKMKDNDPRVMPTFSKTEHKLGQGSLMDYFGIHSSTDSVPPEVMETISRMPFLAYYLIYNYFYRDPLLDEDYSDDITVDDLNRLNDLDILYPRRVNWSPDYFTSARPTTQYGSEVDLDMDGNGTIKVNEMRFAEALQRFKEKMLSSATYIDVIRKFFPAYPSDYAVQRPKLLSSSVQTLSITDVDQTAPSSTDPVGNMAGKSVTVSTDAGYKGDFDEHGIVLGLMFVKPRQSYMCGVPRMFNKKDAFDLCFPHFANLGMQDVKYKELNPGATNALRPWGYQERYADYKYPIDVVCAQFSKLQFWHFGRDIRNEELSKDFLTCIPSDAPFAVRRLQFDYTKYNIAVSKKGNMMFVYRPDNNGLPFRPSEFNIFSMRDLSAQKKKFAVYYHIPDDGGDEIFDTDENFSADPDSTAVWRASKPDEFISLFDYRNTPHLSLSTDGSLNYLFFESKDFKRFNSVISDAGFLSFENILGTIYDPIMVAFYHDEKALRPLPKIYNPSI